MLMYTYSGRVDAKTRIGNAVSVTEESSLARRRRESKKAPAKARSLRNGLLLALLERQGLLRVRLIGLG